MSLQEQFIGTLSEIKTSLSEAAFTAYLWEHEDLLDINTAGIHFNKTDFDRWCYRHIWLPKIQQYENMPVKYDLKVLYYYTKPELLDSLKTTVFIHNTKADRLVWRTDHWDILRGSPFALSCVINNFTEDIPLNEFLNLISEQTTKLKLYNGEKINIYRTISLLSTIPPQKLYLKRSDLDKILRPCTCWTSRMSILKFTLDGLRVLNK